MSGKTLRRSRYTKTPTNDRLLNAALNEWRRLMTSEIRLRERIHHQHRLIIEQLETSEERAEMRDTLAKADHLLARLKDLLGETGVYDDGVLGHGL
jgi:hypothetical protein